MDDSNSDIDAAIRANRVRAATPRMADVAKLLADPTYNPDKAPFVRFVGAIAECAPNPSAVDRQFAAALVILFAGYRGHPMPGWFAELGIDAEAQYRAGEAIGELVKRAVRS